jgi:hypothetical protein
MKDEKDIKQYKNGSKGKNPGQTKKKSGRGHGCLSLVSDVCCQVEVSASGWSLVQTRPWPTRGCCAMAKKKMRQNAL